MNQRYLRLFIVSLFSIIASSSVKLYAQIPVPASTLVTENFNAMTAGLALPANWKVSSQGGGSTSTYVGGLGVVTQAANSGTPTLGGAYNWGTTPGTDRAVGFMTDATYTSDNSIMAFYQNTTASTTLNVSFTIERYRVNTAAFSLSFSSSTNGNVWTAQPAGDIAAGLFATGPGSYTFGTPQTIYKTFSITIPASSNFYLRWVFTTPGNINSQGLGLDNVSVYVGAATPVITSKLRDALSIDNPPVNRANPGDQLTYTNVIKNNGSGDATSVLLTNPAPAQTTYVGGSLKTSSLARDESYSTPFNTTLNVAAGSGVLLNDFGVPAPLVLSFGPSTNAAATASGIAGSSDNGGTLVVNANGSFNYTPAAGFTGIDKFAYLAGNGNLPNNDAVVTITVAPDIIFTTTDVNLLCNGVSTGSITFNASGGTPPLQYSITGAGGTYQASNVFSGLAAGVYNLAVKDAANYIKTGTTTLTQPPVITFNTALVHNTCSGGTVGSITFTASGGTGTLTYSITGTGGTYQASNVFSGLAAGTYPLAVKDANGCIVTGSATITAPPIISFSTTNVNITCNGGSNGSITFTASGGTGTLTYSITGAAGTYQASNAFTGLIAGTYNPAVKDANGCIVTAAAINLTQPAAIVVSGTIPNLVYNVAMANATFTKTNGVGSPANPWSISAGSLPTGVTLNTATGVVSGTPLQTGSFNVTITYTDATGCFGTKAIAFTVAPNLASNSYNVVGNTQLVADGHSAPATPFSTSATNIVTNDQADVAITITAVTNAATTGGGSITIDVAGKFTYSPPVGSTVADSYVYTGTANGISATATINFTIANMVWYVNKDYVGGSGVSDGRSHRPYTDVASAEAASAINQIIYVHTGTGNTAGNALLKSGQTLRGAGSALTVGALSIAAGTKPTLTGMITLANSVTVDGFDMSTGATTALTSSGATGVTVNIGNVTTAGATNAVTLTNTTGTVSIAGGTLTGGAGAVFNVSGGTATISCAATINQATAGQRLANIQSITGGSVTLSGNLSSTGTSTGINVSSCTGGIVTFSGTTKTLNTPTVTPVTLATNTGATINFTNGGLAITSTTATGFNATGGGIINVTGTGNTITSTTGTALNVVNTTIGASNLTFQSISANGAASGIIVNNTGTSGGLVVTGTGSAGTGGTIQNSTSDGVVITSSQSPNLSYMNINDQLGGATDDGMVFTNITGSVNFSNLSISGSPHNGITFDNFNTNLTSFVMTNCTIACPSGFPCQPSGSVGNDGILLVMRGTSILTSGLISGCTFSGVRAVAVQIQTNDAARIGSASGGVITAPAASNSFTVQSNTFTGNGQGIDMGTSQVSSMAFQVLSNTIVGKVTSPGAIANTASSHAINAFTAAGADTGPGSHFFVGKIDGNIIGTQGIKDSGSGFGNGIRVVVQGQTTQGSVTVSNNTIREVPNATILNFFGQNGAGVVGSNTARFKIINNIMPAPSGSNLSLCGPANTPCADAGIFILADEATPVCNIITGNTIYDLSTMNGSFDIYLAERIGPPAGAQLTVEGTGGSNSAYIIANNTLAGAQKFVDEGANTSQVPINSCGAFPSIIGPPDNPTGKADNNLKIEQQKTKLYALKNVIPIKKEGEKWVSRTPEKVNK